MADLIKITMPGNPAYLKTVRLAVGALAAEAKFPLEEIEDICTATGEACQLVFCHEMEGYAKEYMVECEVEPGHMVVSVINDCNDLTEKHSKRCLDCPKEGDLGFILIKSLMDKVDMSLSKDNQRTIRLEKFKK